MPSNLCTAQMNDSTSILAGLTCDDLLIKVFFIYNYSFTFNQNEFFVNNI